MSDFDMKELRELVRHKIGPIPEVDAVFTQRERRERHLWTVLSVDKQSIEDKVYAAESEILAQLRQGLDLHVVVRNGRDLNQMFPGATCLYKREDKGE